jgi:hypothetical protein
MNPDEAQASPYDIVELQVDHEGHRKGDRGTVVQADVEKPLVDFNWRDGHPASTQDAVRVPCECLRIVQRRHPGRTGSGWGD